MKIKRRRTRRIWVGKVPVGGGSPIPVQSMLKIPAWNIKDAVRHINGLEKAGCGIIRIAVLDSRSALAISTIKKHTRLPVVADVHFNYRLALEAIKNGADKIRLNPGNIKRPDEIKAVVEMARQKGIPIRIGVNSGSISVPGPRSSLAQRMADSALRYADIFEKLKFRDIAISLKAPDVASTVSAYRMLAGRSDYPLHLGLTAAGPLLPALVKSSLGIGILLMEGIGDTLRVSLTGSPLDEVKAGLEILKAVGIPGGIEIISCPTCGRCRVNLVKIVSDFERYLTRNSQLATRNRHLRVALMGCEVNGPGEAREADIGVAFGSGSALIFKKGKPLRKISEAGAVRDILKELKKFRQ